MPYKIFIAFGICAVITITASACAHSGRTGLNFKEGTAPALPSPEDTSSWLPSVSDEIKMGHTTDAFVQQQFVLLDDDEIGREVNRIGQALVSHLAARKVKYRFRVINHNDLNAFSAPGGYIYVTYGLLRAAQTKDEVAGILAHEIAHVEKRHQMKSYRNVQAADLLINVAAIGLTLTYGENVGSLVRNFGPLGELIVLNSFDRTRETEADDGAIELLHRTRYHPRGLVGILRRIYTEKEKGEWQEKVPSIFLTHPPTLDRVERIETKINESPAKGDDLQQPSIDEVKNVSNEAEL